MFWLSLVRLCFSNNSDVLTILLFIMISGEVTMAGIDSSELSKFYLMYAYLD